MNRQDGAALLVLMLVLLTTSSFIVVKALNTSRAQQEQRRMQTMTLLNEARDALIGFAVVNGRLPCPASAASNGGESFCTNAVGACGAVTIVVQNHGRCSNPYNGFLPAVTLGLSGVDAQGLLPDGWGSQQNHIRYAVYTTLGTAGGSINTIVHPFTGQNATFGMKVATMAGISARTPLLSVCASATTITAADCGAATVLTNTASAVIYSVGKNVASGGTGLDETANPNPNSANNDPVFVNHSVTLPGGPGGEFDDLVIWLPTTTLFTRMSSANQLP